MSRVSEECLLGQHDVCTMRGCDCACHAPVSQDVLDRAWAQVRRNMYEADALVYDYAAAGREVILRA